MDEEDSRRNVLMKGVPLRLKTIKSCRLMMILSRENLKFNRDTVAKPVLPWEEAGIVCESEKEED